MATRNTVPRVSVGFITIQNLLDRGITLTFLPQCCLWIFSRPGFKNHLFMQTYSESTELESITSFYWVPKPPPLIGRRRFFFSDEFGMHGYFRNGNKNEPFFMKRGPHMYFCPTDKKWKNIRENYDIFNRLRYSDPNLIHMVVDKTHNAVNRVQRWWRRESNRVKLFNLSKLLVFHRGITTLTDDCIHLIARQLTS
jgi:hypothetical protein